MGAQRSNFPVKFPQNGSLLVPKQPEFLPKLRSMAKIVWLRKNTKVALRNIAVFWCD